MSAKSPSVAQPMGAPPGSELRDVIDEFARVLDVLGSQLSESMQEAERECAAVGRSFATARGGIDAIVCNQPACTVARQDSAEVGEALDAAVVGLQYHDRLAQRIGHIRAGLHQLEQALLEGTERSRSGWLQFLRGVESSHRLEQERLMAAGTGSNGSAELF